MRDHFPFLNFIGRYLWQSEKWVKPTTTPFQKSYKNRKHGLPNQRYGCHAKSRLPKPVKPIKYQRNLK